MRRIEETCPLCGARGVIDDSHGVCRAHCGDCYDPHPEEPGWRHLQGMAFSEDEATGLWLDRARELAAVDEIPPLPISYTPTATISALAFQLACEAERQRGWFRRCAGTGNAPETCPIGGELLYGPAYSPTWPDTAEAEWAS